MIDIHSYFPGYESYIGLAIIYDFTACWMIKYKHMANVLKFDIMYESHIPRTCITTESNFQTIGISLLFIPQWAVKFWIIAKPLEFSYNWQ